MKINYRNIFLLAMSFTFYISNLNLSFAMKMDDEYEYLKELSVSVQNLDKKKILEKLTYTINNERGPLAKSKAKSLKESIDKISNDINKIKRKYWKSDNDENLLKDLALKLDIAERKDELNYLEIYYLVELRSYFTKLPEINPILTMMCDADLWITHPRKICHSYYFKKYLKERDNDVISCRRKFCSRICDRYEELKMLKSELEERERELEIQQFYKIINDTNERLIGLIQKPKGNVELIDIMTTKPEYIEEEITSTQGDKSLKRRKKTIRPSVIESLYIKYRENQPLCCTIL